MKVNQLVDDLDGSIDDVRTRQFAIDGKSYEIDLSDENYAMLCKVYEPYVIKARVVTNTKTRGSRRHRAESTARNAELRQWAKENGFEKLGLRGRIPRAVIDAYNNAHSAD